MTFHRLAAFFLIMVTWMVVSQGLDRLPSIPRAGYAKEPAPDSDIRMPIYKPRRENAARARIGGNSRGAGSDAPQLIALVPDHIAFTIKSDPALCWYLSTETSRPITLTVVDARGIRPVLEHSLPSPIRAGIHCVRLREYGVELKEQEQYRWFVTLVLNPERPSQDVVAGGMIERIPFDEACALNMPCTWTTCELEAVHRYAESGLWYDSIACLLDLMGRERDTTSLQRMLDHLLRQSGVILPGMS
jgi:hypothetical protein